MNKNDESERNGFVWPVILKNPNAHANVDFYYGPYDSLDSLKEGVPNDLWVPGFTAAVQDEDGVVTEWWVQGEGASARWEQKGVRHDTYVALKGVRNSLAELEAIENPEVGDMYLVPDEGETGSYSEYVWTGEKWELLGTATTQMKGTLSVRGSATMTDADGRNTVYDGSQNVVLDLSKLAKKTDLTGYATKMDLAAATPNDGTLKITVNTAEGNKDYTFTANQSSGTTVPSLVADSLFQNAKKITSMGIDSLRNEINNLSNKIDSIETISDYTLVEKGNKDTNGGVVYSLKDNNTGIDLGLRTKTNDNSQASPKPTLEAGIKASSAYIKSGSATVTASSGVDITSNEDITIYNTAKALKILLSDLGVILRCSKFDVILNDNEGLTLHYGGSDGSHKKRARISPLVLYLKLWHKEDHTIGTLESWNPYGYKYSVTRNSEGNYTITFSNAKFFQFAMVGSGCRANQGNIFVSTVDKDIYDIISGTPPTIKFKTANDNTPDDFVYLDLLIYDFSEF